MKIILVAVYAVAAGLVLLSGVVYPQVEEWSYWAASVCALHGLLSLIVASVKMTDAGRIAAWCWQGISALISVGLGIRGVSLHSYRYAWAERAKTCGYPERFAQEALGHNSKAIHRAYARKAQVRLPSLESYERQAAEGRIIQLPPLSSEMQTNGHRCHNVG